MAFSTRRFVKHIDKYDVTHRLEIQEDGFGGSEDSIGTTGQVFQFEHETHAGEDQEILNVYENPVQKGSIELFLRIDNSTDCTLIDDIFDGDEDDFRLVWKIDGTIFWTGTILNDMLEYPESDFPYMAKLWAKDFSRLEGIDYTLDDTRQTLITTFADLIGNLDYGLNIQTHTSWTTEDTTDATDFLQQIYHETKALREFARTGDESDTTITAFEALEMMCRNFGCVIRQEGGVFKIIQYSEYETPTGVNVTVYDSAGAEDTSATSTDLSLDASTNDITITDRSITRAFKAIRRARNKYDHRSSVSFLKFEQEIILDSGDTSESQSQLIISDGGQTLTLEADIEADIPDGESNGRVQWQIEIDTGTKTYYWDEDNTEWTETTTINETDLTFVGPGASEDPANNELWIGTVTVDTTALPNDADGTLTVTLMRALSDAVFADQTRWINTAFNVQGSVASENSTSIDYVLTQSGGYSSVFELADTWFGDGPTPYSPGALRHGSADGDFTTDSWQRRGTTSNYRNFHENLLKEIVDLQRGNRIRTDGETLGADYDPEKILTYRSKSLAYTGGGFDGRGGDWKPVLFEINVVTGSDTFEDLPKFTDETGSGTGSSGGGSSGGLDQSTADARYLKLDASNDPVTGAMTFEIGNNEFRIEDGDSMFVVDGATGQIGLGADPLDDVGLLLDTPARAVSDNTDYDRLKVTNSEQLTIAANTTSSIVATAQFDEPNINLAGSGGTQGAVTNAATVYIESAPTEGDDNWALYAPSGATLLESLDINGTEFVDRSRNVTAGDTTLTKLNISDGSARPQIYWKQNGNNQWHLEYNESSGGLVYVESGVAVRHTFFDGGNVTLGGDLVISGSVTDELVISRSAGILLQFNDGTSDRWHWELDGDDLEFVESGVATQFVMRSGGDFEISNTLTINSQLLFTAGNEQLLSTDASPTFADVTADQYTATDESTGAGVMDTIAYRFSEARGWGYNETDDRVFYNAAGGNIPFWVDTGDAFFDVPLTIDGDVTANQNLFVEGGLFVKEFTVDTTRVLLSHRFGSGGIIGEIVDSTVGSEQIKFIDQDGNEIVPFADNDLLLIQQRTGVNSGTIVKRIKRKVVADSQPSNVVSLTTSGATTGTDVGTIAVGDNAVLDGNTTNADRDGFIGVDVLDMPIGAFKFYDGVTDFGGGTEIMRVGGMDPGGSFEYDSSLTGDVGIAGKIGGNLAFALTEDEGLIGGFAFDESQLESSNLSGGGDGSFTTAGILINSGGYISAPSFYLSSAGGGALGALDVEDTLTMGASGEITNATNDYEITADGIRFLSGETLMFGGAANTAWIEGNGNSILAHSNAFEFEALDDSTGAQIAGSDQLDSWIGGSTFGGANFKVSAPGGTAPTYVGVNNVPFFLPTFTETERDNIGSPQEGYVVYNTTTDRPNYYNGTNWVNF